MYSPVEYAKTVVDKYRLSGRANLDILIERIGGHIKYVPFLEYDASIRKHNDTFVILVDSSKPTTRQRFSIAHELGHLFLHLGYDNKTYWNSVSEEDSFKLRNGVSFEEQEANQFAAELLMPSNEFKYVAQNNLIDNVYYLNDIADYFGTSVDSVNYRGINLGLWDS